MPTYFEFTGKTIQDRFLDFDNKNPMVWSLFKQQVFKAISKGKKKVSSKTILGFIRWEISLQTTGKDFKINDIFSSRYARKFQEQHPDHKDIFETRNLRS